LAPIPNHRNRCEIVSNNVDQVAGEHGAATLPRGISKTYIMGNARDGLQMCLDFDDKDTDGSNGI
jgi:hypothetical protein